MNISIKCYFYTLGEIRRGNNVLLQTMSPIQRMSARCDLVVLSRICIILGLLLAFFYFFNDIVVCLYFY
jgi:hypothetical protein